MPLNEIQIYEAMRKRFVERIPNNLIADGLHVDPAVTSRAVQEAFDLGILALNPPRQEDLMKELMRKMPGLTRVEVVRCEENAKDLSVVREAVAKVAAGIIMEKAVARWQRVNRFTLGISGGRLMVTLSDKGFVQQSEKPSKQEDEPRRTPPDPFNPSDDKATTTVYAIAAAGSGQRLSASGNFAAGLLKLRHDRINAIGFPVAPLGETDREDRCPRLDDTQAVVDFLRRSLGDHVADSYEKLVTDPFDVIVTSIGTCLDEHSVFAEELGEIAPRYLEAIQNLCKEGGIVGELLFQPIRPNGEVCYPEKLSQPYIAMPLSRLRELINVNKTEVILSAMYKSQAAAIRAAHLGKFFSILVCTQPVAEELLSIL